MSSASKPSILLLDEITLATPLLSELRQRYDLIPLTSTTRAEFLSDCSTKYADASAIYRHFNRVSKGVTGLFDKELVAGLPSSIKFICHNGAGYDQIDVVACTEKGIQVSNVPTAVDGATADTALFLLLGALRQFGKAQANLREGKFNKGLKLSNDPQGKVLGVVGLGGIGRAFAARCRTLGMTVQCEWQTSMLALERDAPIVPSAGRH